MLLLFAEKAVPLKFQNFKFYTMKRCLWMLLIALSLVACRSVKEYDVVVVGGGTSGVAAALQSSRMGAKTLLVEEFDWLGGMLTSAGVSATDGNYQLRGGVWNEFRTALETHYGGAEALKTGWVSNVMFEPSVGDSIFKSMVAREPNLEVVYRSTARDFSRESGAWTLRVGDSKVVARVLIDATERGDVAREVGVEYDLGMDSKSMTGEEEAVEEALNVVQDLTYVAVVKDYGRDVTIPRPEGYDPMTFACCCENPLYANPKEPDRKWSQDKMLTYGRLPNGKYMINWPIEGNDYYVNMVDMTAEERREAVRKAKNHTLGFLYFMQTELGMNTFGLADDEFPTKDLLPFIPYHRESRRIHGKVQFTLTDISNPTRNNLYRTTIAVGDYPVDQHHTRHPEWQSLPDLYFHPVPSYGVPLGVMLPEKVEGLIVTEKSISVTNLVNGSTRLQPVVLQLGQAAGALAALAVVEDVAPDQVGVRAVQRAMLEAGGYLLPYLDLPVTHPYFGAMQRIGATGILRGRGANVGWSNQTWFDAEKCVSVKDLSVGLRTLYPQVKASQSDESVKMGDLARMLEEIRGESMAEAVEQCCAEFEGDVSHRALTRLECAVVVDRLLDPFAREVDIQGNFVD